MIEPDTAQSPTHASWWPMALSVGGALAAMVGFMLALARVADRYVLSSDAEHAIGHAVLAVPLLALLGASLWFWPAPRPFPSAERARRVIVGGLGIVCTGQVLEATGALAYDGDERVWPALAILHDLGVVGGPLGLLVVGCGIALAMRAPSSAPRALDLVTGGLALVGVASIFVGLTPVVGLLAMLGSLALVLARWRARRRA
jgi:hypothetical protein